MVGKSGKIPVHVLVKPILVAKQSSENKTEQNISLLLFIIITGTKNINQRISNNVSKDKEYQI